MYIQANIGRNVAAIDGSTRTMNDTAWLTFQQDVKEEIIMACLDAGLRDAAPALSDFQVHTGEGEWDGVKEESAHVSVYFDDTPHTVTRAPHVRDALTAKLSYMAFQYGQDAIAFIVTDSHLAMR